MPEPRPPESLPPQRRQQVIDVLSRRFADDTLTLDEFERRLDVAVRAAAPEQLDALLADLPAERPESSMPSGHARISEGDQEGRQLVIAVLSGNRRAGRWTPRRKVFTVAAWGGAELDFREVALPPGVTEVTAIAVMGGVDIVVPPGVGLEVDGFAFLGGLDPMRQGSTAARGGDAPRLRITGFALMGAVSVDVRFPGETPRDARRRRRDEQRQKRLERRNPG